MNPKEKQNKKINLWDVVLGILLALLIITFVINAKSSPKVPPNIVETRDVSGAIVIVAQTEQEGVHAEYQKITEIYGVRDKDWALTRQLMFEQDGKQYDELQIQLANGEAKTIIFDISQFSGKFN